MKFSLRLKYLRIVGYDFETVLSWSKFGSESMIIFSGGLTTDKPAVTVMKGKSVALLELDFQIISIIPLIKSPWNCDVPTPGEMFVLLGNREILYRIFYIGLNVFVLERDLITIDLESVNGYPQIEIPHPIDFHDTPITSVKYIQDSKSLFISGLLKM